MISVNKLIKSRIGVFDAEGNLLFEVPRIAGNHPSFIKRKMASKGISIPYKAAQERYGYQWVWIPA